MTLADVAGDVIEDLVLEPGSAWGRVLKCGQRLRIIDLRGKQAVDFLCFDAADPRDRYNAANTMKMAGNVFLSTGVGLWSDRAKKLMSVAEDTCGYHDTIGGCCSAEMNLLRYRKTLSGQFEEALRPFGLTRDDIVANVNWFMYVPVEPDGSMQIADGRSKPMDYVELVAERDVICVASICAQLYNPANGFDPTPVRMVTYAPRS